jgi:hypothetical protein
MTPFGFKMLAKSERHMAVLLVIKKSAYQDVKGGLWSLFILLRPPMIGTLLIFHLQVAIGLFFSHIGGGGGGGDLHPPLNF